MPVFHWSQTFSPSQESDSIPVSSCGYGFLFFFFLSDVTTWKLWVFSSSLSLINIMIWQVTSPNQFPLHKLWAVWTVTETRQGGCSWQERRRAPSLPAHAVQPMAQLCWKSRLWGRKTFKSNYYCAEEIRLIFLKTTSLEYQAYTKHLSTSWVWNGFVGTLDNWL